MLGEFFLRYRSKGMTNIRLIWSAGRPYSVHQCGALLSGAICTNLASLEIPWIPAKMSPHWLCGSIQMQIKDWTLMWALHPPPPPPPAPAVSGAGTTYTPFRTPLPPGHWWASHLVFRLCLSRRPAAILSILIDTCRIFTENIQPSKSTGMYDWHSQRRNDNPEQKNQHIKWVISEFVLTLCLVYIL
jgi:hypothetical protein